VVETASEPIELQVLDEGRGPAILLLHGAGLSRSVWNDVVAGLAPGFRVLAVDLRGHGRSSNPPSSTFSFLELEGDLLRLLDAKQLDRAYVVGHSGGALLALRFTLDHPERVSGLVMISGAAYTDSHTRSITQRWTDTYQHEGPDAFGLRLLKDLYYPDWIEAHLDFADRVRAAVQRQDLAPATRWSDAMAKFDEKARVPSIRVPTLIVQAMDDQVVDASHGRILRQSIPGAQIRILPQTGHMVPLERPKETVEAIAIFVRAAEEQRGVPRAR